jgi:hypothetical protein
MIVAAIIGVLSAIAFVLPALRKGQPVAGATTDAGNASSNVHARCACIHRDHRNGGLNIASKDG